MAFLLTHYVDTGKEEAKHLVKSLKHLQQTMKAANVDNSLINTVNSCLHDAQELASESFLFIEKETKNAQKMADYFTENTIREVVEKLAQHVHAYSPQNGLAALVLRYFFEGVDGKDNRRALEARLRETACIGGLGDYPWHHEFEDVVERFKSRVEELALKYVVQDAKAMLESQVQICFSAQK